MRQLERLTGLIGRIWEVKVGDLSTLPKKPPYGLWVFPNGKMAVVNYQNHNVILSDLIIQGSIPDSDNYFGYRRGFEAGLIRVVIDRLSGYVYYEAGREYDTGAIKKPSRKAMRTLKDVAILYGLEVKEDTF